MTTLTASEKMNTEQYLEYNRNYNKQLKALYVTMLVNKDRFTAEQIESKRLECRSLGVFV
jgi:hypothetical protein